MKNFVQPAENVTLDAPAAVLSGDIIQVGALLGIASTDAAAGEPVAVVTVGAFTLPKLATDDVVVGDVLYHNAGDGIVTLDDDTGNNARIGVAIEAAGNPSGTVVVRLDG